MSEGPRIYNLFPPLAGPIRNWTAELPRIAAMGFDSVYLNPFHYPGFSGSLYAVKDYYRLNPRFRGDRTGSDDDLLRGFTAAAARQGLRVIMDLVVNHTARDSDLTALHPDWFAHGGNGEILSPHAVDPDDPIRKTVWGDLAALDYRGKQAADIIAYFEAVVRHYITLGFGGFRCDAAYKVPAAAWRRLIGAAKAAKPDVVFLAENLGAQMEEVLALRGAGFDYLFNSVKWWDFESPWLLEQYEIFRHIAPSIGFPESHDTERLAADLLAAGFPEDEIEPRYRQAYAFAASFSSGIMMPMGYEFGWARRLDVVAAGDLKPEPRRFDISPFIAAVNRARAGVPALNEEGPQRLLASSLRASPGDPLVVLLRLTEDRREAALILANIDPRLSREIDRAALTRAPGGNPLRNLRLSDVSPEEMCGRRPAEPGTHLRVGPLEVRLLRASGPARRPVSIEPCRSGSGEPGHHALWRADSRVVIEEVQPELDGGRYPVKRLVGDIFEVSADLFRDGHDKLRAVVKYRAEGGTWQEAEFAFFDNDRWVARFPLDRVGRWRYAIEAWTDPFESWREDLTKKLDARQDVELDLVEGVRLVEAAARRAAPADAARLKGAIAQLPPGGGERSEALLSASLRAPMARLADRSDRVRYPLERDLEITVDRAEAGFAAWYEMFPRSQGREPGRSATFDDCIARLPEIAALGFDVVYLLPIYPIGRVNRKGRNNSIAAAPGDPGSPYAIGAAEGGHRAINPELGTLGDFRRFVAAAAALGLEVALDFAAQCAPDHPWVREHRDWFHFRPDGSLKYAENPPKKYEDIVNIEFYNPDREGLWNELRDTVLFWIDQGVRIFRVDNPHTKPLPFWEWLIREVKAHCPEAVFLAEAFTRPKMMRALAKTGFSQSYTYFTWRNTKAELIEYMTELTQGEAKEYFRPNFFTNTPDILPLFLQEGGRAAFRIRLVLAATLSPAYGIYNGFELCENGALPGREEYRDSEKYEYKVWDWDRPGNIKDDIAIMNRFRRDNPAMREIQNVRFLACDDPNILAYAKTSRDRTNIVIIAVNLDPGAVHQSDIVLPLAEFSLAPDAELAIEDAMTEEVSIWRGERQIIRLDPATNPFMLCRLLPADRS